MNYIKTDNNHISISGIITYDNIESILCCFKREIEKLDNIIVNFNNLVNPNSMSLLFIINCIRECIIKKKKIYFINISTELLELSKVYNLYNIINKKIKRNVNETNINN